MHLARPTVLILGPTAAGKTQLAINLARRLPEDGECICCDSMQVYRSMDIGTAKPTGADQARVPHHLLDIVDPNDDSFSVDRWLDLANQAIAEIRSRGKWPIVVGGTNLYVQALLVGIFDGPPPDPDLRSKLAAMDLPQLREWLSRIDPTAAQRIHPNDRKRTTRAIEVFEQTGRRISTLQTQWGTPERSSAGDAPIIIGLEFPAEVVNRRINARVRAMMDAGFVAEVRRLHESNRLGRNARAALGYKQLIDFLEGGCHLDTAVEQIKIKTRQYAKQQRSWLRRFRSHSRSRWIDAADIDAQVLADQALESILALAGNNHRLDISPLTA